MSDFKLSVGLKVKLSTNYSQQIGEVGNKLVQGNEYEIINWFPFGGKTMLIMKTGEYVYRFNVEPTNK